MNPYDSIKLILKAPPPPPKNKIKKNLISFQELKVKTCTMFTENVTFRKKKSVFCINKVSFK